VLTGTTVVTREPEWDDAAREWAIEWTRHQSMVHPGCGNHMNDALDTSVARFVERVDVHCEDCAAIKAERDRYHRARNHDAEKVECDCHEQLFYIDKRVPLEQFGMQPPERR